MKNTFLLGAAICVLGLLTACDATPLGKGYVYFSEYPNCNVCKKIAWLGGEYDVVLPPAEQWKDKGDLAVNVFWDDTTVLAVGCKELMANDTICWKLNKKTGIVQEITPEDFYHRTHQGKMRHSYVLRRYKQNNN